MLSPECPRGLLAVEQGDLDSLEGDAGIRDDRTERRHLRHEFALADQRCLRIGPIAAWCGGGEGHVHRGRLGAGTPVRRQRAASTERLRRRRVVCEHLRPRRRCAAAQPLLTLDPSADPADGEASGTPLAHRLRPPVAGALRAGQRLPQGAPSTLTPLVLLDRRRAKERERRVKAQRYRAVTVLVDDGDTCQAGEAGLAQLVDEVIERQQRRVLTRRDVPQGEAPHHHAREEHLQLSALGRPLVIDCVPEVIGRSQRVGPAVLRDILLADESLNRARDVLVGHPRQFTRPLSSNIEGVVAHEPRPVPAGGHPRRRDVERCGAFGAGVFTDPASRPVQ